ncbi:MAG: calcium/sodium antiporter [Chloroflexi bacterium]|nr:calcium/sodium antiporter [Chloroflexota bacterium]
MLLHIGYIVVGLFGLYFGGEWLIKSAARLATALGVPLLIVGLTVVALGTSAPELVVSVSAALQGFSDIALGNVIGSNIANLSLIIGLAGLVRPLQIRISLIKREIPVMIGISLVMFVMALDGQISQGEGLALALGYIAFSYLLYKLPAAPEPNEALYESEVEAVEGAPPQISRARETLRLLAGLALLVGGAQAMVTGAVAIARDFGISELVIGLTLVAAGTSLPEIATCVLAALRGHSDIAVGNAIGSNIVNILVILGVTALVRPVPVDPALLGFELPLMLFFAVLPIAFILDLKLARWQAGMLLLGYGLFVAATLERAAEW